MHKRYSFEKKTLNKKVRNNKHGRLSLMIQNTKIFDNLAFNYC